MEHDTGNLHCDLCAMRIRETHEMLAELMEVLRPLKAMAAGLGPMQKMGMSPAAKEAAARIKALS